MWLSVILYNCIELQWICLPKESTARTWSHRKTTQSFWWTSTSTSIGRPPTTLCVSIRLKNEGQPNVFPGFPPSTISCVSLQCFCIQAPPRRSSEVLLSCHLWCEKQVVTGSFLIWTFILYTSRGSQFLQQKLCPLPNGPLPLRRFCRCECDIIGKW